jgi:hypothetical protein
LIIDVEVRSAAGGSGRFCSEAEENGGRMLGWNEGWAGVGGFLLVEPID